MHFNDLLMQGTGRAKLMTSDDGNPALTLHDATGSLVAAPARR